MPNTDDSHPGYHTIEHDTAVVFCLDSNLRLVYANAAWDRFASANGGDSMLRPAPLGRPVLESISGPLKEFYASIYARVLESGQPWQHRYECSSPTLFREFAMQVLPVKGGTGLMVVNSLLVEHPPHVCPLRPIPTGYRDANGIIVMCGHCRRTRRPGSAPEVWDLVAAHISALPPNVSHGLCGICLDYYYSEHP